MSAAPEVLDQLFNELGDPFGIVLEGGVIITTNGVTYMPSTLLPPPAAPPEPADDVRPATLAVPDTDHLLPRWNGKTLEVLDALDNERMVAQVRPKGKGGAVKLDVYFTSGATGYHTECRLSSGRHRWSTEEEICRAYGGGPSDHAAVAKFLLTVADFWLEGPSRMGCQT